MKLCNCVSTMSIAAVMLVASAMEADAESRTWKDATGAFTLDAELVEVANDQVKLKKQSGEVIQVELSRLSSGDQQYVKSYQAKSPSSMQANISLSELTGKAEELANDDGTAAGKKSFPRGIASAFQTKSDGYYLTRIKIHGARYGSSRAPKEDFIATLCDSDFNSIAEFKFPYSRMERGNAKWVTLRLKPTKVPRDFVICLNFNPNSTKGVFVSHDADGKSLVGLPGRKAGAFTGGDWMVRAIIDRPKSSPKGQ